MNTALVVFCLLLIAISAFFAGAFGYEIGRVGFNRLDLIDILPLIMVGGAQYGASQVYRSMINL
jgi:hypothetical protein